MQIEIPDSEMTEEQELDALYDSLCEELTGDQLIEEILSVAPEAPDLDEDGLQELDKATAKLAVELGI